MLSQVQPIVALCGFLCLCSHHLSKYIMKEVNVISQSKCCVAYVKVWIYYK